MKSYVTLSVFLHGAFLATVLIMGTLLSKPKMSYYSVDLFSSLPAGTPGGGGAAAGLTPAPAVKPPTVPAPPEEEEKQAVTKEAIKIGKPKRAAPPPAKRMPKQPPALPGPRPHVRHEPNYSYGAEESGSGSGAGVGGVGIPGGGGGSGVVGEAGPTFPYPWYLKAIADKLDKQWHPPHDFQSDTMCQVAFTISRGGEVSESKVEKASGDTFFDQLAMRAVLYSNPLPPLPTGFPENSLRVHMKFVGKRF